MDTADWVTSTIAVLALVLSAAALMIAVRSATTAKAARAIDHAPGRPEPLAGGAGVETEPAEIEVVAAPPPVGVAWKIEHDAGITWRLCNIGTEPAYDVNAVGQPAESAGLVRLTRSFADVPAGGSLSFHVVRTAHHPNITSLAVTWSGQSEPVIVTMR